VSRFIIYGLIDPTSLLVRYVGMSSSGMKRPRQHRQARAVSGKTYCARWIRKLFSNGLDFEIVILEIVSSQAGLPDAEKWWIAYGRACGWPLTNLTDGGEGLTNPSERTREKMRAAARIRMTPQWRAAASERAKVQFGTPEARAEASRRNGEYMRRPEVRAKNSRRSKAQWAPQEARDAQRERSLRSYQSVELRAVIGEHSKARMCTPEGRARQSAITKARMATPEARARHAAIIRVAMARPDVAAKIRSGDDNPAKRPEVRAKMRESSRRRWERVRNAKREGEET